jgi:O-antigen ligase
LDSPNLTSMLQSDSKNNITKRIFIWLVGATYVGMFFPIAISNIPLILLFVFSLLQLRPSDIIDGINKSLFAKLLLAMYLLQIVGLLYTTNYSAGFFMLEKKVCFLLIPVLVLPTFIKLKIDANSILRILGIITVASSLILFCIAFYRKFILNDPQAFFFESFGDFEGFSPIHYVYYAMYFGCGSLILIDSLYERLKNHKFRWLAVSGLYTYSLGVMTLVASKTGIGAFILATLVFLFFKIPNKKVVVLSFFVVGLLTFLLLSFNETTQNRFKGLTDHLSMVTEGEQIKDNHFNGLNMRLLFWKTQISQGWKDRIFFTGTGTGDNQDYIDSVYKLSQYKLSSYVGWDSHNQWVYTLVQVGVVGVLLMGALFFCYGVKAIRSVDVKLLSFLIVTLGFSFTESILESNKGIVFFTFLFCILDIAYCEFKSSK